MRKEVLVTRSCETTVVSVKAFDTVNNAVKDISVSLVGRVDVSTEKGLAKVKDALKSSDDPFLVFILVNSSEVTEEIRGMSLEDFMKYSKPIKR